MFTNTHGKDFNKQNKTHSGSLTSTAFSTQIQIRIPHATWSAQDVHESKTGHTNAIYPHCAEYEPCKMQWFCIKQQTHIL